MAYKFLESKNAKTGGIQLSNNRKYLHGNFLRNKEYFDYDSAILRGNLYEAFWRGTVGGNSTLWFHHFIPSNRLLKSVSYQQKIVGGPVIFDLILGGTPGTTAETFVGYNGDRRRFASGDRFTSTSELRRISSFDDTNSVIVDQWFGLTPATGSGRQSVALAELGAGGLYDSNSRPTFKIVNESSGGVGISFSWVWIEFDPAEVLFLPI